MFASEGITLYRTVAHRDRATFYETIPPDWPGVLVSDCLSVYDGATPVQQKCYSHHLRAVSEAAAQTRAPTEWVEPVRRLLHGAMGLQAESEKLRAEERIARRRGLEVAAAALLDQPRADPAEERLRARLFKQRDHLFTFLDHPGVEATNNLAERELRPAVIARKLSCGHRTGLGAQAWARLTSLARTCARRAVDFADFVRPALLLNPAAFSSGRR